MAETVGAKARELLMKPFDTRDPIELEREMQKKYLNDVYTCVERGKKVYAGPFYVVVLTKKEPLMPNVLRQYFLHRSTCPRSDYDQTVFKYHPSTEMLEYVWTVPDKETCQQIKAAAIEVEEKELRDMVLDFYDGTLDRRAAVLNNEYKE